MSIVPSRSLIAVCAAAGLVGSGAIIGGSPAAALSPATVVTTPSAVPDGEPTMSGWLPYWSLGTATSKALANADLFSDVSPFWFDAVSDSSETSTVRINETWISSGSRSSTTQSLQAAGLKVLPSITDSTGRRHLAGVLAAPSKRTALVRQITNLVDSGS